MAAVTAKKTTVLAGLFTKNVGSKLLALICAIGLWVYIQREIQHDDDYTFVFSSEDPGPQEHWISIPRIDDLIILPDAGSEEVDVKLTGPTESFRGLPQRIRATLPDNLFKQRIAEGTNSAGVLVPLDRIRFDIPSDLTPQLENPDTEIKFSISRRVTRQLTVDVPLTTERHPNPRFRIGTPIVQPNLISVSGPAWEIGERSSISLEPIAILAQHTQTQTRRGRLPDEQTRIGVFLEEPVEVTIPIEPAPVTQSIHARVMIQTPFDLALPEGRVTLELDERYLEEDGTILIDLEGPAGVFTEALVRELEGPGVFYIELSADQVRDIREDRFTTDYWTLQATERLPSTIRFAGERPALQLSRVTPENNDEE